MYFTILFIYDFHFMHCKTEYKLAFSYAFSMPRSQNVLGSLPPSLFNNFALDPQESPAAFSGHCHKKDFGGLFNLPAKSGSSYLS